MSSPLATVGVISIGQMGLGIAKLLVAHNFHVMTNVTDRSNATQSRARDAQLDLVDTDVDLVNRSDYILSIVPPRDALATAQRIISAFSSSNRSSSTSLYYLDLNAIAPSTATSIADAFSKSAPQVHFVDGGIIGGPPSISQSQDSSSRWTRPGIPLSGPNPLHSAPVSGSNIADVLNTRYLDSNIGSASGLKCCFAALSKGLTALTLQSFTTAKSLDVLPALQDYLREFNPSAAQKAEKSVVGCTSKAYRWVEEMNQIGVCFAENGGWREQAKVFREIADVFEGLAETVENRKAEGPLDSVDKVVGTLSRDLGAKVNQDKV